MQKKAVKEEKRGKKTGDRKQKGSGRCKSNWINNDIKCEWIKQSNQTTEIARLEGKKQDPITCHL